MRFKSDKERFQVLGLHNSSMLILYPKQQKFTTSYLQKQHFTWNRTINLESIFSTLSWFTIQCRNLSWDVTFVAHCLKSEYLKSNPKHPPYRQNKKKKTTLNTMESKMQYTTRNNQREELCCWKTKLSVFLHHVCMRKC